VQGNGDDGDATRDQTLTSLQTDLSGPVAHALVVMLFVGSGAFYATSGGRCAGVSRLSLFAGGALNAVLARAWEGGRAMERCLCRSVLPWLLVALGVHLGGKDGIGPTAEQEQHLRPLDAFQRDSTASVSPQGT
jgi:hypothetical protein